MIIGLMPSFHHRDNGMTMQDMFACKATADLLDEVIIFRSTGPWSMRWIEAGYPTKNFHVKGKSSDWGPQAGFVPYNGVYSKVGYDDEKAKIGTVANDDGLKHHFAKKVQLALTLEELQMQATKDFFSRTAIARMEPVPDSRDYFLFANRFNPTNGSAKTFVFRAVWSGGKVYHIFAYPERMGNNPKKLMFEKLTDQDKLMVMTSSEVGADNKPMTGDYDLMAVCPRWGNYGSPSGRIISKPGLNFHGKGVQPGLTFGPRANLDKVLDMSSNTGAVGRTITAADGKEKKLTFQGRAPGVAGNEEHGDMGNLTPRILRCINTLNAKMGGHPALRRVHHNAESHRNAIFSALTASEMEGGDGLPLTVFQPKSLCVNESPVFKYGSVATLETLQEFRKYAGLVHDAGYFVPRNWTWGMSIRDLPRGLG